MGDSGPNQEQLRRKVFWRQEKNLEKQLKNMEYLRLLHKWFRNELTRRIPVIKILKRKKLMNAKLHKRLSSAMEQENWIKIWKSITKNNYKHTYHVSFSSKGKMTIKSAYVAVVLAPVPTTKKRKKKNVKDVYSKRILLY